MHLHSLPPKQQAQKWHGHAQWQPNITWQWACRGLWAVLLPELCQVVVEMWELCDVFNMCGPLFCSALHAPGHVRPCSGCKHAPSKLLGVWEAMPHPQRQGPEGLHGRPPAQGCWAALWPGGGGGGAGHHHEVLSGHHGNALGTFGSTAHDYHSGTLVAPWGFLRVKCRIGGSTSDLWAYGSMCGKIPLYPPKSTPRGARPTN